jgi:hypothetical protein
MAPGAGSAQTGGNGRRRLLIAGAVGLALVGALVALQLVDDGDDTRQSSTQADGTVHVKGEQASRPATIDGRFAGADGFTVEVVVITPVGEARATADADGHFRVTGLAPGPVDVSWVGETSSDAGGGVSLGAQRTGHTQVTLDAGRNRLQLDL